MDIYMLYDLLRNDTNNLWICTIIFGIIPIICYLLNLLYKHSVERENQNEQLQKHSLEKEKLNEQLQKLSKDKENLKNQLKKVKTENDKLKKDNEKQEKQNKKLKSEIFFAKKNAAAQWKEIERDLKIQETIREEVNNLYDLKKQSTKTNEENQTAYGVARGIGAGLGIMLGLKKQ